MNIQQNIQKIKYLRLLSESLKGGWDFNSNYDCPCGQLSKIVLGHPVEESIINSIEEVMIWAVHKDYSKRVQVCDATGLPMSVVIQALYKAGFTKDEIIQLEETAEKFQAEPDLIFPFITQWRNRIISETESQISELDADLKVEVLLSEFVTEKQLA